MKIHLITYATPRFRHRQILLGLSARLNGIVDTVCHWTPDKLAKEGFEERCPEIRLSERGSGYWAWKPFIIEHTLAKVPKGDLVFYCDVGRRYPYKQLDQKLEHLVAWMDDTEQPFMPGLSISWRGPLSDWTKRDAFHLTGMDHPKAHSADSVQASFSLWQAGAESQDFVRQWLDWCCDRRMVSDDPSTCGIPELPGFHEHRHDQSLLTLCCLKRGAKSLATASNPLPIDTRDPSQVLRHLFGVRPVEPGFRAKLLSLTIRGVETTERGLRTFLKFGKERPAHPLATD